MICDTIPVSGKNFHLIPEVVERARLRRGSARSPKNVKRLLTNTRTITPSQCGGDRQPGTRRGARLTSGVSDPQLLLVR